MNDVLLSKRRPMLRTGVIALILVLLSVWGWTRLSFTSSMQMMLPEDSDAQKTIAFFQDTQIASKAILWFKLHPNTNEDVMYAAADKVLGALDPEVIARAIRPPQQSDAMMMLVDLIGYQCDLVPVETVESAMEPEALKKRMREIYMQMLKPSGAFMGAMFPHDPLGVSNDLLGRMYGLTKAMGFRADIQRGHFVHPEGRELFIVLETIAPVTDIEGSRKLVAHLDELIAKVGPGVTVIPIAGHLHTVQNDQVMRADIQRVAIIGMIGFAVVFLLVYRDWRVGAIFGLPLVSIGVSIGLCGMYYSHLAIMVVGMAATMAGGAMDYAIFVYTAVRMGTNPFADARRIALPLLTSALTTTGIFVAFMFSGVPAYRQLGAMTSMAFMLSALASLYILPAMVKGRPPVHQCNGPSMRRWGRLIRPLTMVLLILFVLAAILDRKVQFDPSLSNMDGVSSLVKANEHQFQQTWTKDGQDMAIVAVTADSMEQAASLNDQVYKVFHEPLSDAHFVSLASVWPSPAQRAANRSAWQAYWDAPRIELLQTRITDTGKAYGFAADAFAPFFNSLKQPQAWDNGAGPLKMVSDQFVIETGKQWIFLNFFQDNQRAVAIARDLARNRPGVQVVSNRALGQEMADASSSESRRIVLLSLAMILLIMLAMTRHVRRSLIMLTPALASILAMLALSVLTGRLLNPASIIAGIVVFGLCVDYGVFTVDAWRRNETMLGNGMSSVHLSWLTTMVGGSALLWAEHPVLFLVALTITTGLSAGYITALAIVPAVCQVVLCDDKGQTEGNMQ